MVPDQLYARLGHLHRVEIFGVYFYFVFWDGVNRGLKFRRF